MRSRYSRIAVSNASKQQLPGDADANGGGHLPCHPEVRLPEECPLPVRPLPRERSAVPVGWGPSFRRMPPMQFSPTAATATQPAELTTDDLATRLQKSHATIREYARLGLLTGAYRCGRDWRFPHDVRYTAPQAKPAQDDPATAGPSPLDALRAWRDA